MSEAANFGSFASLNALREQLVVSLAASQTWWRFTLTATLPLSHNHTLASPRAHSIAVLLPLAQKADVPQRTLTSPHGIIAGRGSGGDDGSASGSGDGSLLFKPRCAHMSPPPGPPATLSVPLLTNTIPTHPMAFMQDWKVSRGRSADCGGEEACLGRHLWSGWFGKRQVPSVQVSSHGQEDLRLDRPMGEELQPHRRAIMLCSWLPKRGSIWRPCVAGG